MTVIAKKSLPAGHFRISPLHQQNKAKLNYGNACIGAASHLCGPLHERVTD